MADLIDRDTVLPEITRCKDYAHKNFARSAADKKQKNFYEHTAYCEGVFDAWGDAETLISRIPAVNRWIPCSERLPEDFVWCLVCMSDGCIRLGKWNGEYDEQGVWWVSHPNSGGKLYRIKNVPFWMPLPEPPKE